MKRQIMSLLLVSALVVNLVPTAAFAQELPETEVEEFCEHLDTELIYEPAGEWLHAVTAQCICGEEVDWYEEDCQDEDGDGWCDLCDGELPCLHEDTELTYVPGEEAWTHTSTEICACGEEVDAYEESCADEDGDALCDLCQAQLPCLHEDVELTYAPGEEERIHTATEICACGEEVDAYEESCADEDGDALCDLCQARLPCLHKDTTVTCRSGQREKTHIAVTLCACGEEVDAVVESCDDGDSDGLCDGCEVQLEEPITLGDVDGDGAITQEDASVILRYIVRTVDTIDEAMADVDGDGMITAMDATCILRYCENLIDTFPGEA